MSAPSTKERLLNAMREVRKSRVKFLRDCLKIRDKDGNNVPFVLNRAQKYVERKLDQQLRKTGKVRALLLKGRQQGISTYVGGRYYHKASLWHGVNVYILTHEAKASNNLFKIVARFQECNPLRPHTNTDNAKELEFDKLDSTYTVATAGQKAGGRSSTGSLFHGSEVAFWPNAPDHFAASVQTVPFADGTEIILETTANGPSGEFYERWQDAEAGKGDYIAIFVPWFWQEEYYRDPEVGFKLADADDPDIMSEIDYAEMFELNLGQMCWRRAKIQELGDEDIFNQEYPATAQMAFVNSGTSSFIKALGVLKARKRSVEGAGPLIMGADPAGPGGDRFAIAGRRGHEVCFLDWRNKIGTSEAYLWCKELILEMEPARFNVDAGGIGAATLSLLRGDDDIPKGVVRGVNFGEKSQAKKAKPNAPGPKNRRAEMWNRLKEWLHGEEPVSLPDLDVLQADITGPRLKPNLTNDIQLESKEDMKLRKVRSPDLGDAVVLTFASASVIYDYVDKPKPKPYGNPDSIKREMPEMEYAASANGWMG